MIKKFKELFLRYYSIINNWNSKKVVLIISSGRTGTNFMAHWFSMLSDDYYSVHEPSPDLFYTGIEKFREKYKTSDIKLKRALQLLYLNRSNKEIYIESNPNMILLLPELNKLFKNLKIIFIKRDFETYFLSAMNKSPDNSNVNYFYSDTDSRKRITAIDLNDQYKNVWNKFSREEKIAWWWKTCNEIINDYCLKNTNAMVFKFEDIFNKNNKKTLLQILDFIDLAKNDLSKEELDFFTIKKNTNPLKKINDLDELDKNLKGRIYSIIG